LIHDESHAMFLLGDGLAFAFACELGRAIRGFFLLDLTSIDLGSSSLSSMDFLLLNLGSILFFNKKRPRQVQERGW
jgi:hypothetical protein